MQLTSPALTGTAGRISAHFQQAQGNGAQDNGALAAKPQKEREQGIAFGASFKTDPGAPVQIEATRLDVDDTVKQAVFTGDVRAVQGDFIIRAAEITAAYTGSAGLNGAAADTTKQTAAQLSRIKAKTKVQITSKDGQSATGDWADFDPKANMATLGGDVVLTQGKNVVRGTKLVIDMNTGESVIKTEAVADGRANVSADGTATTATGASSRPSAVFYPGELKANSDKKKSKEADGWQARPNP
jgi:lipopolysaccharide transport protein LptA